MKYTYRLEKYGGKEKSIAQHTLAKKGTVGNNHTQARKRLPPHAVRLRTPATSSNICRSRHPRRSPIFSFQRYPLKVYPSSQHIQRPRARRQKRRRVIRSPDVSHGHQGPGQEGLISWAKLQTHHVRGVVNQVVHESLRESELRVDYACTCSSLRFGSVRFDSVSVNFSSVRRSEFFLRSKYPGLSLGLSKPTTWHLPVPIWIQSAFPRPLFIRNMVCKLETPIRTTEKKSRVYLKRDFFREASGEALVDVGTDRSRHCLKHHLGCRK